MAIPKGEKLNTYLISIIMALLTWVGTVGYTKISKIEENNTLNSTSIAVIAQKILENERRIDKIENVVFPIASSKKPVENKVPVDTNQFALFSPMITFRNKSTYYNSKN